MTVRIYLLNILLIYSILRSRGASKVGTAGLQPTHTPPPPHTKTKFRNTDFVDTLILNVLRDLPFGRNNPLKSSDDYRIIILKNKTKELGMS
jgi:hypothetical protein